MTQYDTVDRIALGVSGALATIGIVVSGVVEIVAGEPYGAAPVTNDAGEVVATPAVDPTIRTGLVIAALVVLLVWGLYRVATTEPDQPSETADGHVTAD
ncbi:hypothetical protein [Halobaculum sp. MBLA0143]|uniref:hypothetical protein n=1 Tax=Halobaculum sp. MBLA0143 TaxID=3079933 RepID=UPI0035255E9C